MTSDDPHDLQRFAEAQRATYEQALAELQAGAKRSHWMWFVFPQLAGLGRSAMAERYAIATLDEARAYLAHPLLGARLIECSEALLGWAGRRSLPELLGAVDALKLRSSMTLFAAASGNPLFEQVLHSFCDGAPDPATLRLLSRT